MKHVETVRTDTKYVLEFSRDELETVIALVGGTGRRSLEMCHDGVEGVSKFPVMDGNEFYDFYEQLREVWDA